MRIGILWLTSTAVILAAFVLFAILGWPGAPDRCTAEAPNTCYCEAYELADVEAGRPGIRQPANTLFNLYSLLSSAIIVIMVRRDRRTYRGRRPPNLMKSTTWFPEIYMFAVLFLGLGSMWFHASLTSWGGVVDGLSMYVFVAFLVFYSALRMTGRQTVFWVGYPTLVVLLTILHAAGTPSFALILTMVGLYLVFEVTIWIERGEFALGAVTPIVLWISAALSILVATLFWVLSQTDAPLCDPESVFQPHGLLWHPLAGVMALLLYFYWRCEEA